ELCGLSGIMHRPISELSKGLKQRVGIAHAMMSDPEILILDEPTSGLDPNQIVEIREIIRRIGKEKTIILSTHILSEAEATCDRVVIINKGKIVADGSTESLKLTGNRDNVINISLLNADENEVKKEFDSIDGIKEISTVNTDDPEMLSLRLTCMSTDDLRRSIYRRIKLKDWILMEFHQERKSLENIFRELTKEN
ncbi:MAG: ATP-binding cassette domain-containing protein, partial [Deltaproteobacteria bacterium]|nr:ATP-binding cassette domain-containing protein [Deltaproteobacteria bacterium]